MDPRKQHEIDQETGPLHEMAIKLAAYLRSLQREGFTAAQAFRLVRDYQREIIRSILRRKDDDGR